MSRACPVTGQPMTTRQIDGVTVDVSPVGMWLDKGEFYLLTEAARHAAPSWTVSDLWRTEQKGRDTGARTLSCPDCGAPMEIETLHGVQIDWCREHGTWLDAGEYEAILNNLRLDPLFLGKIAMRLWETRF